MTAKMKQTLLLIENIHCPSCISTITETLSSAPLSLSPSSFSISLLTGVLALPPLPPTTISAVEQALLDAGFDVSHPDSSSSTNTPPPPLLNNRRSSRWFQLEIKATRDRKLREELEVQKAREAAHVATCRACREGVAADSKGKDKECVIKLEKEMEVVSTILITGMTCSSCVSNVAGIFSTKNDGRILSADVTLMPGRAVVRHVGIEDKDLIEMVEDGGYEGEIVDRVIVSLKEEEEAKAEGWVTSQFAIEGMTCSSCVGSMDGILKGLPAGIRSSHVTLLPPLATVVHDPQILSTAQLIDEIEDGGYGAELVSSVPVEAEDSPHNSDERNVKIRVEGMFCEKCSNAINALLSSLQSASSISSFTPLSLAKPMTTITYKPSPPHGFTIRTLRTSISSLGPFTLQVLRPSSTLTNLALKAQEREARAIFIRLGIAFLFAIPTFIIGIVFMTLLKSDSHLRTYFSAPIWGSASRGTIALFALSTPVQFGVGSVFYLRAWKSLRGVWRRTGSTRWRDRALRWGSMDTLVALGTTAGWVASVAYMALDVSTPVGPDKMSGEMGYFDSSVFLVLFILAGRTLEGISRRKTGEEVEKLGKMKPPTGILMSTGESEGKEDKMEEDDEKVELESVVSEPGETSNSSNTEVVDVDFLEVGDILLIPSGSSVPLDAVLLPTSSCSNFDESSLTGESHPILKSPSDPVYSGSTNLGPSAVKVRVTTCAGDTLMDGIVSAVRDAMARKASIERVADMVTGYFVPVVTGIACLTFGIWIVRGYAGNLPASWLSGEEGRRGGWALFAVQFAVAVLVVACPCGIGLAAPTAQMVGTGIAATLGIVPYGGGEAFQNATKIDCVVFDKTGTITLGTFKVSDHHLFNNSVTLSALPKDTIWKLLEVVEETSGHPISEGVRTFCQTRSASDVKVNCLHSEEIPGRGLAAVVSVDDVAFEVLVGNEKLMEEKGATFLGETSVENQATSSECLSRWGSEGKSLVLVSLRQVMASGAKDDNSPAFSITLLLAVEDPPRPEAAYVVEELRKQGIASFMLTGDNETTAIAIAQRVGIGKDNVFAGVLPVGKKERIERIQRGSAADYIAAVRVKKSWWSKMFPRKKNVTRARVMFVGDGINDIVALTQADVGVSMGTGAAVALSSSDFCLLSSNLLSLLTLLSLAQSTFNKILTNFGWAICFNAVLLPIAAGAFYDLGRTRLPPVWASLAMALSSVSVVSNSLLLRWTFQAPKSVSSYGT